MRHGDVSATAQWVAGCRLAFDRVPTAYGNPSADERLARDVAATVAVGSGSRMAAYLAARTTFFDRLVVEALEEGVQQAVVTAAGYDGRSLRYAKRGVRWFEVDLPGTQQDKRRRIDRLGIDAGHVTFVPADFTTDEVGPRLVTAGLNPHVPSLILCEGVAVYLERAVLAALLRSLRDAAAAGSRLAISLSVSSSSAELASRRADFQAAVAALGEPARTTLTAQDADVLFDATGWGATGSGSAEDQARRAGFVIAKPT